MVLQAACAAYIDARGHCSTEEADRLLRNTKAARLVSQILDADFKTVWSDASLPWVLDGHFRDDRVLLVAPSGSFSVYELSRRTRPVLTSSSEQPFETISFGGEGDEAIRLESPGHSLSYHLDDLFAGLIKPSRGETSGPASCFAPRGQQGKVSVSGNAGTTFPEPVLEISASPSGEYLAVISPGPCNAAYERTLDVGRSCGDRLLLHVDIVETKTCGVMAASDIDLAYTWASQDRFVSSIDAKVWRWDPRSGSMNSPVAVPELRLLSLSPDDRRIVGGIKNLVVWIDLATGKQSHTLVAPDCAKISALRYSEDGHTLAAFVPATLAIPISHPNTTFSHSDGF